MTQKLTKSSKRINLRLPSTNIIDRPFNGNIDRCIKSRAINDKPDLPIPNGTGWSHAFA